ncbi:MAG: hypothetical protein ISF22_05810 [Methanomassiliicoccus sp.]|nr:hypothetical protein [Methanomassiliicoccus sp.]
MNENELDRISSLFQRMADEPTLVEEYKTNPRAVLSREDISPEAIDAIVTGDISRIREMFSTAGRSVPIFWIIVR